MRTRGSTVCEERRAHGRDGQRSGTRWRTWATPSGSSPAAAPGPTARASSAAADATDAERLTALTRGAVALYNCANPPYDKWLTAWPPLASALLTAAESTGAGLVAMGNLYGYGPVDGPMTEETPLAATGPKGRMRNRMWADMLAAQDAGRARVTEARASDFYGPGPVGTSHLGQYFMPRLLAGKRPVVMQADLDVPHSFTYVPDVARTLVALAGDDRSWGRAWHVPTAPAVSLREIATRMAAIAGVRDRGVWFRRT